jgi:hypothetical protein
MQNASPRGRRDEWAAPIPRRALTWPISSASLATQADAPNDGQVTRKIVLTRRPLHAWSIRFPRNVLRFRARLHTRTPHPATPPSRPAGAPARNVLRFRARLHTRTLTPCHPALAPFGRARSRAQQSLSVVDVQPVGQQPSRWVPEQRRIGT